MYEEPFGKVNPYNENWEGHFGFIAYPDRMDSTGKEGLLYALNQDSTIYKRHVVKENIFFIDGKPPKAGIAAPSASLVHRFDCFPKDGLSQRGTLAAVSWAEMHNLPKNNFLLWTAESAPTVPHLVVRWTAKKTPTNGTAFRLLAQRYLKDFRAALEAAAYGTKTIAIQDRDPFEIIEEDKPLGIIIYYEAEMFVIQDEGKGVIYVDSMRAEFKDDSQITPTFGQTERDNKIKAIQGLIKKSVADLYKDNLDFDY